MFTTLISWFEIQLYLQQIDKSFLLKIYVWHSAFLRNHWWTFWLYDNKNSCFIQSLVAWHFSIVFQNDDIVKFVIERNSSRVLYSCATDLQLKLRMQCCSTGFLTVCHHGSIVVQCLVYVWKSKRVKLNRARKSRTTLQNKVRLKVLPEQLTLFVNTSVTFKKCIIL